MSTRQDALAIRSILDVMLLGENVTRSQIEFLRTKISELIEGIVEGDDDDDDDNDNESYSNYNYTQPNYAQTYGKGQIDLTEPMDDLPF